MAEAMKQAQEGGLPVPQDDFVGTAVSPEEYKGQRETLLRFINHQLEEAEYDGKKIVRTNDYYVLPGSTKKALSKKGAELLMQFYRFKVRRSEIVEVERSREYVYARAEVEIHRSGIVAGAQSGACSSAEVAFQRQAKKYGIQLQDGKVVRGDWRAAMNDIEARAQKRALVRAVIAACGAADILEVADDHQLDDIPEGEAEVLDEEPLAPPKSERNGGPSQGKVKILLALMRHPAFSDEDRKKVTAWVNTDKATDAKLDEKIVRAEELVDAWDEEHRT